MKIGQILKKSWGDTGNGMWDIGVKKMEYGYEGKKNRNKEYQGEKRGIWDNGFIAIPKYLVTNFL